MTKDLIMGDKLHEAMKLFQEGKKKGIVGALMMGEAVYLIKEGKLWMNDCVGVPTFKAFAQHEMGMAVSQAYRLQEIFVKLSGLWPLCQQEGLELNISTVTLLLPVLQVEKSLEEKMDIIRDNANIPLEAVKNNVLALQGKGDKATDVCLHNGKFEYYRKCVNCNKFFRMDDKDGCCTPKVDFGKEDILDLSQNGNKVYVLDKK